MSLIYYYVFKHVLMFFCLKKLFCLQQKQQIVLRLVQQFDAQLEVVLFFDPDLNFTSMPR